MKKNLKEWDLIISSERKLFEFKFYEIFQYLNVIQMFVKRDFVVYYKQTLLGPLWYIIQPLVNTLVFAIIFGKVAKISTEGVPPYLFYLAGNICWAYFSICLTSTSSTFLTNSNIFGKVYFPRLTVPIANVIISLLQFSIQFFVFLLFIIYFSIYGYEIEITLKFLLIPFLLLQMALLSLGFGILISSLTTKYRDLTFVMTFGVQLWMFATPIVYPLSIVPENYRFWIALNPMTSVVELFRDVFFQNSSITSLHIFMSIITTIIIFLIGVINFNRMEKNFMDTI
tara:strand:+ start:1379 stop:2230 length:852 start_codon:yes stop_codon:yes gene_type:complete